MTEPATNLPAFNEIAAALAKAQAKMTNPPKNRTGQCRGGKYRYSDLAEVIDHTRAALSDNGLSVSQLTVYGDGRNTLVTRLLHSSGQYLEATYPLPVGAAAQEMGSAITYARRYSLCAILGIAADEDDDGAKAGNTEAGHEKSVRDELVERMGAASLGNHAILTYTRAQKLGDGQTVEDLDLSAVEALLAHWDAVVEAIRKAKAEKPAAKTPPPKVEPVEKPAEAPAGMDGINKALADLMTRDGITPDQLRGYYSGAGHFPATVEPAKLQADYIKALTTEANWKKAVIKMKEMK